MKTKITLETKLKKGDIVTRGTKSAMVLAVIDDLYFMSGFWFSDNSDDVIEEVKKSGGWYFKLEEMEDYLNKALSSYNKQLLDGIEKEVKELPTESVYDHEGDYYYGTTRKKDVLSALNKYRV